MVPLAQSATNAIERCNTKGAVCINRPLTITLGVPLVEDKAWTISPEHTRSVLGNSPMRVCDVIEFIKPITLIIFSKEMSSSPPVIAQNK